MSRRLAKRMLRQQPVAGYRWREEIGRCESCSRSPRRRAVIGEVWVGVRRVAVRDPHGHLARGRIYSTGRLCLDHVLERIAT